MNVGDKIREIRTQKHISQIQLAEMVQSSQSALASIESGNRVPRVDTLQRIAAALQVNVSELLPDMATGSAAAASDLGTEKLLSHFAKLNASGQNKVIAYAADLEKNPDYKKA